tara:strand:- start:10049 stop:10414 length:366 start_codon:yes stop_codon:yes gene_type:complete
MMNLIPLIGVHMFIYPSLRHFSIVAAVIYINGVLYHSTNNKYLKYNDIITNSFFISYMVYNYTTSRKYATLGIIMYLINLFLYEKKILGKNMCDINHVLGVQLVLLMGFTRALKELKLKNQ